MALILIILPGWPPGRPGERPLGCAREFLARFIQTDLRALGSIRALLDLQHLFHLGHTLGRRLGDAPGLYVPRFDRVFFSRAPTAT